MSWTASVELWFMGQGMEDHLSTKADAILAAEGAMSKKIDAFLCNMLWQTIDLKLYVIYKAY